MRMGAQCSFTLLCAWFVCRFFVFFISFIYKYARRSQPAESNTPLDFFFFLFIPSSWFRFSFYLFFSWLFDSDFFFWDWPSLQNTNEDSLSTCWVAAAAFLPTAMPIYSIFGHSDLSLRVGGQCNNNNSLHMKREILSSFLFFYSYSLHSFFFLQKKHTKEINHPWVWFIVRESILCSAFLFCFILLLHLLRETGKNEIEIFYFFFLLLLIDEFHSVKATLGSFHRDSS